MKTKYVPQQKSSKGSVLIVSMSVLAIGAILLASYLTLVETQTNAVARSQTWNSAVGMTEAGLEEGMAMINAGSPNVDSNNITTQPWNFTNNLTANGWPAITNGGTSITRYVSASGSGTNGYTVWIDTSGPTPTVTAAGFVAYTQERWGSEWKPLGLLSLSHPFIAQLGTTTSPNTGSSTTVLGRRFQVATTLSPLFSVAVLTRSNFNMHGNGTVIDSFDSSNPLYSSNGQYYAAWHKANGSLATDSAVVNDLNIGNGNIYGHVYTGPGSSSSVVNVGNQGAVGDITWNTTSSDKGKIEPGYWSGNFNTAIPDVPAPTWSGTGLPSPTNGQVVLTASPTLPSYYTTASVSSTTPLVISGGNVIMWVQGSFTPPPLIFTNGGSLTLYVGTATGSGDSISMGGNGSMNSPGLSANLLILGLPSLTSIVFSGNAQFCACIYAPEADVKGNGSGSSNIDTSGSLVVNSVTLNGHWNFHYDEALVSSGASRGWIAKNWSELKY